MPGQGFDISVTANEVQVKQDGSLQSGGSRATSGLFTILVAAYGFIRIVVVGRRRDPGFLYQLMHSPHASAQFVIALIFVIGGTIFTGYLFVIGVRLFFPAGEELQCDRSTFTYSQIPFVSFGGRWKRRSFPSTEVSELIYGVIQYGDPDKNKADVYGLSFMARGKEYKIFAGLEADDADEVVKKLRNLGVDVIINQDMSKLVEQTDEDRNSRLGIV